MQFKRRVDIFGLGYTSNAYQIVPVSLEKRKSAPPFNMTIFKGQKNVVLSRKFVDFVLNHEVAQVFRKWIEDMNVPDESFYATLSRISKVDLKQNFAEFRSTDSYFDRMEKK